MHLTYMDMHIVGLCACIHEHTYTILYTILHTQLIKYTREVHVEGRRDRET